MYTVINTSFTFRFTVHFLCLHTSTAISSKLKKKRMNIKYLHSIILDVYQYIVELHTESYISYCYPIRRFGEQR